MYQLLRAARFADGERSDSLNGSLAKPLDASRIQALLIRMSASSKTKPL
jgi:hypothetical protein